MPDDEVVPEDPGWPWFSTTLLPGMTRRYIVMHSADDQRRVLRSVTVGFVEMLVAISALGVWLGLGAARGASPVLLTVCGVAMLAPVLGRRAARPLDCTTDVALVESYRTRFFLRAAFANVPGLAGFVVIASGGPAWLFGVGVVVALVAFAVDAPTRAHLAAEDAALRADGCDRSLVAALAQGAL
jgi:hypothetical protein